MKALLLLKNGISARWIIPIISWVAHRMSKFAIWGRNLLSNLPSIDYNCLLFRYYSFAVNHTAGTPYPLPHKIHQESHCEQSCLHHSHTSAWRKMLFCSVQLVFPFLAKIRSENSFKSTWNIHPDSTAGWIIQQTSGNLKRTETIQHMLSQS